jgi:hypothetical protein
MGVPPMAIRFIHSIEERYIKHLPKTRIPDISMIDGYRKSPLAGQEKLLGMGRRQYCPTPKFQSCRIASIFGRLTLVSFIPYLLDSIFSVKNKPKVAGRCNRHHHSGKLVIADIRCRVGKISPNRLFMRKFNCLGGRTQLMKKDRGWLSLV